jgi:hypothetical protein
MQDEEAAKFMSTFALRKLRPQFCETYREDGSLKIQGVGLQRR